MEVAFLFLWYNFHAIHVPRIVATPTGTPIPMAILSDVIKPLDDVCAAGVGEGMADGLLVVVPADVDDGATGGLVLVVVVCRCTWFIVLSCVLSVPNS